MPADTPDMVLVPREPTVAMIAAACGAGPDHPLLKFLTPEERGGPAIFPLALWRAMLSASPAGGEGALGSLQPSASVPTEQAGGRVLAFGHFQRGAQACREMMARFVEATHPEIAQSIRLNWHPGWGNDPGRPPFVAATWEPEQCPEGEAARKAMEAADEPGPDDLEMTARMLETWGPVVEPASPDGKVSFTRAMMDSAAIAIRRVLKSEAEPGAPTPAIPEVPAQTALKLAISHIDHMAAWISANNRGYSFEALGEDMATIKAGLTATPEGLRGRLQSAIAQADGDYVAENGVPESSAELVEWAYALADSVLAALQPQAQGGE